MKKETRYRYAASDELMIMRFIRTCELGARKVEVDVIYSDMSYFPLGKRRTEDQFWARSRVVTGRADKMKILLRKFE